MSDLIKVICPACGEHVECGADTCPTCQTRMALLEQRPLSAVTVRLALRSRSAYAQERILFDLLVVLGLVSSVLCGLVAALGFLPGTDFALAVCGSFFGVLLRFVAMAIFDLADASLVASAAALKNQPK